MSWKNKIKKAEDTSITLDELKAAMEEALSVINTTHFKDKISVKDADYGYVISPLINMLIAPSGVFNVTFPILKLPQINCY